MSASDTTTRMPEVVDSIMSRASAVTLKDPGPTPDDLRLILKAGTRAPDHGKLQPWRFVVIEGTARDRLGDVMAETLKARKPDITEIELKREKEKSFRSPTIVAVGAKIVEGKIMPVEQMLAAAAAAQNIILAAHALGYGTMWKTGDGAYDDTVKRFLGFDPGDSIVGFIYIGTADMMPKNYRETKLDEVITRL
jgi:nitroreductase